MTAVAPAALLAACSLALAVAVSGGGPTTAGPPPRTRHTPSARVPTGPVAVVGAAVVAAGLGFRLPPVVLLTLAVATATVVALRRSAAADRAAAARQVRVVDACEALTGELRAGQPLVDALAGAVRTWEELRPVHVTARLGGDVPAAFREVARRPGAGSLEVVGAAWQLCATHGTGLADALGTVLQSVRSEQAARHRVRSELAATRATARLVTGLPLVLLLMAHGAGADPAHLLLRTAVGQGCLLVGTTLLAAGNLWVERLARAAVDEG